MAKFCGKCGAKLDMQTGMCPVCQREQILAQQKNSRTRTRANKRHPLRTVVFCILIFIIAVTLAFLALRHKKPIPEELAQTAPSAAQPEQRDEIPQRVQAVVTDEYFDNSYVSPGLSASVQKSLTGNTYCYHIPRVNLDAPDIARTNRQIYEDLYYGVMMPYVYSMAEPHLKQMAYTYGEKGDILSILVCAYDLSAETYHDNRQYWFYNISKTTGALVSDEEVAGAFGISPEEYDSLVKQAVEKKSWELYMGSGAAVAPSKEDAAYRQCLEETLFQNCFAPYIDEKSGDLCLAGIIFTVDGDGEDQFTMNLTGTAEPVDPEQQRDITQRWGESQTFWNEIRVADFYEIRDLLGVPAGHNMTVYTGTPYYRDGCPQWIRRLDVVMDGNLVAGASVGTEPCRLGSEIEMYNPQSSTPFTYFEDGIEPMWSIEGVWILNEEENRPAFQKLTFGSDGYADVLHADGTAETLPYRTDSINTTLYLGSEKYLYSVWPGTGNLYLFPNGQKSDPIVYTIQY